MGISGRRIYTKQDDAPTVIFVNRRLHSVTAVALAAPSMSEIAIFQQLGFQIVDACISEKNKIHAELSKTV